MKTRWAIPWRWALVVIVFEICCCEAADKEDKAKAEKEKAAEEEKEMDEDLGPCMPGERRGGKNCYWTKLLGLGFSEGYLAKTGKYKAKNLDENNFDPDWLEYELEIKSGKSKELLVTPMLDVHKYDLLYKPDLIWNGKKQTYSPIQNIEFPLELNMDAKGKVKSPGELNRKVTLKVSDPKDAGGTLLGGGGNEHTYTIRVIQAPDIENIVTAKGIHVVGLSGDGTQSEVQEGAFNASSPHNEIRYVVGDQVHKVQVTVTCPEEATGLKYNGVTQKDKTEPYTSNEFEGATKSILGQCLYSDDKWTKGREMQRTYVITVARNSPIKGTSVDLRMWPPGNHGKCKRIDSPEKGMLPGWHCMKAPPDAQFVGSYDNPKAELVVVNKKTGGRYRLWNGIPTSVPVPKNKNEDELILQAGTNTLNYAFIFERPPQCNTLKFGVAEAASGPKDPAQRKYWSEPNAPWKKYQGNSSVTWRCPYTKEGYPQEVSREAENLNCAWKPCTHADDGAVCCHPVRPPCNTYDSAKNGPMECGHGLVFHPEMRCPHYPCKNTAEDRKMCCHTEQKGGASSCTSMACPLDSVLKESASSLTCFGNPCTTDDTSLCCEQRAICDSMTCPHGFSRKYNAGLFLCKGAVCGTLDRDTCCDGAAYCSGFDCPGPSGTKMGGATRFKSPLGWVKKPAAATIPCGGSPCIDWDTGVCCNRIGFCAAMQCPIGFYPKKNAEQIPCDGVFGSTACDIKNDLETCCEPAARCIKFNVCPNGYRFKLGAKFITCPGTKCLGKDRNLCCDMTNPFEAAEESTALGPLKGEGECHMIDSPSSWTCKASGKTDALHLVVNYTFEQAVGNKVFMNGDTKPIAKNTKQASVKLPAIPLPANNPVHVAVRAFVAGRGPAVHRLQIFVHGGHSKTPAPSPATTPAPVQLKSAESGKNSSGQSSSEASKESSKEKEESMIKESTLRQLSNRRLSEAPSSSASRLAFGTLIFLLALALVAVPLS